jgi:hypothetical protein
MEWISVEDGLPDYDTNVLVYWLSGNQSVLFFWADKWDNLSIAMGGDDHITHWMPLPEPPHEEK